jgi:hypothetical protein
MGWPRHMNRLSGFAPQSDKTVSRETFWCDWRASETDVRKRASVTAGHAHRPVCLHHREYGGRADTGQEHHLPVPLHHHHNIFCAVH